MLEKQRLQTKGEADVRAQRQCDPYFHIRGDPDLSYASGSGPQ